MKWIILTFLLTSCMTLEESSNVKPNNIKQVVKPISKQMLIIHPPKIIKPKIIKPNVTSY